MSTCGQCEFYLTKMDECPHREKHALDKACDKLQYTNPRKRIDYLQTENKRLREAFGLARSMVLSGEKMSPQAEEIFEQALKV